MDKVQEIKDKLKEYAEEDRARDSYKFFRAFEGGYGEGDSFIGVTVPNQRKVVKKFKDLSLDDIKKLIDEDVHEYRLTGLLILVSRYERAETKEEKQEVVDFYLRNADRVNNWDLVDSTAHKILGSFLIDKDKSILYELANSNHLWKQRISIIATAWFINNGMYEDTLKISEILLNHEHDLIHKAVGWMLREVGKRDLEVEEDFLKKHYKNMPRTMLRYAIEKFEEEKRQKYLKGEI